MFKKFFTWIIDGFRNIGNHIHEYWCVKRIAQENASEAYFYTLIWKTNGEHAYRVVKCESIWRKLSFIVIAIWAIIGMVLTYRIIL